MARRTRVAAAARDIEPAPSGPRRKRAARTSNQSEKVSPRGEKVSNQSEKVSPRGEKVSNQDGEGARIEYVALSELERWPRNPKLHDIDGIGASIERFGFVQPILVDEGTGQVVAGHGRLEALQGMRAAGKGPPGRVRVDGSGQWMVPVLRGVGFGDEREAEAYLLADNRLVEKGGWDTFGLAEILRDFGAAAAELPGFDEAYVARALARLPKPADQVEFKELDESVENGVRLVVCPSCGHKFA